MSKLPLGLANVCTRRLEGKGLLSSCLHAVPTSVLSALQALLILLMTPSSMAAHQHPDLWPLFRSRGGSFLELLLGLLSSHCLSSLIPRGGGTHSLQFSLVHLRVSFFSFCSPQPHDTSTKLNGVLLKYWALFLSSWQHSNWNKSFKDTVVFAVLQCYYVSEHRFLFIYLVWDTWCFLSLLIHLSVYNISGTF